MSRLASSIALFAASRAMRVSSKQGLAVPLFLFAVFAAALATPSQAAGQVDDSPDRSALRQGFHFSVGVGSASMSASCSGCEVDVFEDRLNGFSGNLQIGAAVTSKLVIAAEFFGWLKNDDPIFRRVAALNLVFLGYPSENSGFFVKGGVGGLRAIGENDLVIAESNTFTSQAGVGLDIAVGDVMVTPYANVIWTFYGETTFNGFVSPEAVFPNALQVGAALTIH
jgi:hypothetical protein